MVNLPDILQDVLQSYIEVLCKVPALNSSKSQINSFVIRSFTALREPVSEYLYLQITRTQALQKLNH